MDPVGSRLDPTFILLIFQWVLMVFIEYVRYGSHCLRKWIPLFFHVVPGVFFVLMSHLPQDPRHMKQDPRHMTQDPRHVTRDPRHMTKDRIRGI